MVYNLEVPLGLLEPAPLAWLSLAWLSPAWLSPQHGWRLGALPLLPHLLLRQWECPELHVVSFPWTFPPPLPLLPSSFPPLLLCLNSRSAFKAWP